MDFARKQLEKYGWREGQGLGKNEDGISTAIKPKLKFDNRGVGHSLAKEYTENWWEKHYNVAVGNIHVKSSNGSVNVSIKNKHLDINKKTKTDGYNAFVKTAKLTSNGVVELKKHLEEDDSLPGNLNTLTDDELFLACQGRTAHKGARHGLKLNGKLSRLEKQEKLLLKRLKNVSISDNKEKIHKKIKKLSKHKEKCKVTAEKEPTIPVEISCPLSPTSSIASKKKKKRNRSKRRVSFCEAITVNEYYGAEGESSPAADCIYEDKIKEQKDAVRNEEAEEGNVSDEGIEKDLDDVGCEATIQVPEKLSKEEKRLLKKKRKHDKHKNRATARFLDEMESDNVDVIKDDGFGKKRKFKSHSELDSPSKSKSHSYKKLKQLRKEEKQMNSIVKSLDQICTISEDK